MSYSKNWSTSTHIDPWQAYLGNNYTLNAGLVFNGNDSMIYRPSTKYAAGTTTITFDTFGLIGVGADDKCIFSVTAWDDGVNYISGRLEVVHSALNEVELRWGLAKGRKSAPFDAEVFLSSQFDEGFTSPENGTLSVWHNSGTWHCGLTYESTPLTTASWVDTGTEFAPVVGGNFLLAHRGLADIVSPLNSPFLRILTGSYSTQTITPFSYTFWYNGVYNNGTTTGNYDFSSSVISIAPIRQYLYIPGSEGVFDAEVSVTLKNDNNQWGTFTGYAASDMPYHPPGLFYIRDASIELGLETLFAGYIDYSTHSTDALNQTVSFTLRSPLRKLLELPICPLEYVCSDEADMIEVGVVRPKAHGTITALDKDFNSDSGTVSLSDTIPMLDDSLVSIRENLIQPVQTFQVKEYTPGSNRFTVSPFPTWIAEGDVVTIQKPYPWNLDGFSISATNYYNAFFKWPLSLRNSNGINNWGGVDLSWEIKTGEMKDALDTILLSPSRRLFGDETYISVLDDFLTAIGGGGFSCVDGQTVNIFVPSPNFLLKPSTATFDYEVDIYGAFTVNKNSPISEYIVEYAWDKDKDKYTQITSVKNISLEGITKKLSTWMYSNYLDAKSIAYYTSLFFASNVVLNIVTQTDRWSDLELGDTITITNIPDEFEVLSNDFIVISRVFDPETKLVTSLITEKNVNIQEYFQVGIHAIGSLVEVL